MTKAILLIVTGVLTCSSCTGVKKTYADFYKRQDYRAMGLNTDSTALQDGKGKMEILLADKSQQRSQALFLAVGSELSRKGYRVSKGLKGTGLSVPNSVEVIVSNDPAAKTGPFLSGPHTLSQSGSKMSSAKRYAAERLFDRLQTSNHLDSQLKNQRFTELSALGVPKDRYFVAVSAFSRNVNTGKQIGQGVLVAALTLGSAVAYEPDVELLRVFLIDPRTQKVVWANQIPGGGSLKDMNKDVAKLFAILPAYGEVTPASQ